MTMVMDFNTYWIDPRLVWDPLNYNGVEELVIGNHETIWMPDIVPYDTFGCFQTFQFQYILGVLS